MFDKYYQNYLTDITIEKTAFEISKSSLYHDAREFYFNSDSIDNTNLQYDEKHDENPQNQINPNFIRSSYLEHLKEEYFSEKPSPPFSQIPEIHVVHSEKRFRDKDLMEKGETEETYINTRPLMYWDHIPPVDTKHHDITHLMVILRDQKLTEYYYNNSEKQRLIYWMGY